MKINKPTKKQVKDTTNKVVEKANKVVSNPLFFKLLGISVGAYIVYRVANKALETPKPDPVNDIDLFEDPVVIPIPENTTISLEQAKIYAQTLLEAMDRQPWGTYVNRIFEVFKKINADDFKLVFNAFGKKNYNGTGSPPESWFWQQLDNYQERNLVYWLGSELNSWTNKETFDLVEKTVKEAGFIL